MADVEALQRQVDALGSALGHLLEAVRDLHDLDDLSPGGDPLVRHARESLRLAVENMNELNRLRVVTA